MKMKDTEKPNEENIKPLVDEFDNWYPDTN